MIPKIRQTFITLIFFMNEKQEGFELNPLMGSSPAEGHSFKGRTTRRKNSTNCQTGAAGCLKNNE